MAALAEDVTSPVFVRPSVPCRRQAPRGGGARRAPGLLAPRQTAELQAHCRNHPTNPNGVTPYKVPARLLKTARVIKSQWEGPSERSPGRPNSGL